MTMKMLVKSKPKPEQLSVRIQLLYSVMEKTYKAKGLRADGSEVGEGGEWEDVEDRKDQ